MKSLPAGLASHIALDATTLAYGLKITREDGEVFAFTSHDKSVTIDSVVYNKTQGLIVTGIQANSGLAVGNLELRTLHDGTIFTIAAVLGGLWRNAAFNLFRYNWASPSDGVDTLMVGTLGEVMLGETDVMVELRDLRQYLQHPVGSPSTKTCRYRLGDSLCGINLNSSPETFTVTGSVTSVTSNQVFRDSSRSEPAGSPGVDGWYAEGELTWLTGNNAGVHAKVRSYLHSGVFTLALPMFGDIEVGDTYSVHAGCDKTLETCRDKFNNVINFGGEPHRPTTDDLTQPVTVNV